jgi:hypothetical protein
MGHRGQAAQIGAHDGDLALRTDRPIERTVHRPVPRRAGGELTP